MFSAFTLDSVAIIAGALDRTRNLSGMAGSAGLMDRKMTNTRGVAYSFPNGKGTRPVSFLMTLWALGHFFGPITLVIFPDSSGNLVGGAVPSAEATFGDIENRIGDGASHNYPLLFDLSTINGVSHSTTINGVSHTFKQL